MIAEIVDSRAGRRAARSLFGTPTRHVPLAPTDLATPLGTICRVDPERGTVGPLIAPAGSAHAALWRILGRYDVNPDHPPESLAEADALVASPGLDDPALVDFEALPFITIDNDGSRDLDQALHLAPGAGGGFEVSYALADASYYVRPDSVLFADALARGASFYLPGFAVPMLPRTLSEGIVSLNPGVRRRALVFVMQLDATGAVVATRLLRARIISRRQLTYDGVQAYYDDPAASPLSGADFAPTLDLLRTVGRLRITLAEAEDVVQYNRVSLSIGFADPEGRRFVAVGDVRNDCQRYNEQISLLCNIEGARFLVENALTDVALHPVYRVHPAPAPPLLDELAATLDALIAARGLDPALWRWRRHGDAQGREPLADYLERLPRDGAGRACFLAVQRQALLSNQRSRFQAEPGLHYGIGAPFYSRFSSPMREVVGVFTHKEALEALASAPGAPDSPDSPDARPARTDLALRDQVIAAANRARDLQHQLTNEANLLVIEGLLAADLALPEPARPWRPGVVLGLNGDRLYVLLDDPPVEVKLYLDAAAAALGGTVEVSSLVEVVLTLGPRRVRLCVGDALAVRVVGYETQLRRFLLVPDVARAPEAAPRATATSAPGDSAA